MIFFKFILLFLLSEAILFGVRFLLRRFHIKAWAIALIAIGEFILGVALGFLSIAVLTVGYFGAFMVTLYIVLLADSIAQFVFLLANIFLKSQKRLAILSTISGVLATAYLIVGMVNMQIVSPKYLTFSSSKLQNEYTVAFVSDVHVGSSQEFKTTKSTIEKINAEHPDFTILGGDMVDEFTTKQEMLDTFALFKEYDNPVYFIYGNHDTLSNFTKEELDAAIVDAGITILVDEFVQIGPDLTLLGREDVSISTRKAAKDLVNPYPGTYTLIADHQPFQFEENMTIGCDLQLSGHTHAGQYLPMNLIYSFAVRSYGTYKVDDSYLNVSAGASGWCEPFRTEFGCQFEIVTLKPAA